MKFTSGWIFTVLLIISLMACSDSASTSVDVKQEAKKLMELSKNWSALNKKGPIDSLMTVWADDAVLMPPDSPPLKGKEAIKNYLEAGRENPGSSVRWEPVEVHVSESGDMAYMIERNEMIANDCRGNPVAKYNKVVTVWRRDASGNWKNVVDMWNLNPEGKF